MKTWCIIELSHLHDGNGNLPDPFSDAARLDKKHGPTMFYSKRSLADEQLFRLQKKDPSGEFYIFEAVGKIVQSQVNSMAAFIEEPEII